MRGYYLYIDSGVQSPGVQRKIASQVRVLSTMANVETIPIRRTLSDRIIRRLPFGWCNFDEAMSKIVDPDFLYIRKWTVDRSTVALLRRVKTTHPLCKIVLEIPTYPYLRELLARPVNLPSVLKDIWHRRSLKKYVDRIVMNAPLEEIFGIPTIRVVNGVDVGSIRPREPVAKEPGRIDLIAVSTMLRHHGYERVLRGLGDYYRAMPVTRVVLHLVGDGRYRARYERQVRSDGIADHVIFHGRQEALALDRLYDRCDIALDVFGSYRIGAAMMSSLKSREYLARGVPIVSGSPVDVLEGTGFPFYLEFPDDSSVVRISDIVAFYERTVMSKPVTEVVDHIRRFAWETCDMRVAMAPVVEFLASSPEPL